jgi:hypothetical protein
LVSCADENKKIQTVKKRPEQSNNFNDLQKLNRFDKFFVQAEFPSSVLVVFQVEKTPTEKYFLEPLVFR